MDEQQRRSREWFESHLCRRAQIRELVRPHLFQPVTPEELRWLRTPQSDITQL